LVLAITRHVRPTAAQMLLLSLDGLAAISRPRVQLVVRTARHRTDHRLRATSLPTPPPLSNLATSKDAAAARDWLTRFRGCPIPRVAVHIACSRSSGPGGQVCLSSSLFFCCGVSNNDGEQNVNKVNTKATVRCALDSTWIPSWARDEIRESVSCGVYLA
jgi:peptidyl-tRNA hydrolase ICT1